MKILLLVFLAVMVAGDDYDDNWWRTENSVIEFFDASYRNLVTKYPFCREINYYFQEYWYYIIIIQVRSTNVFIIIIDNLVDMWASPRVPFTSDLLLLRCGKLPRLQLLGSADTVLGRGTVLVLGFFSRCKYLPDSELRKLRNDNGCSNDDTLLSLQSIPEL